MTSKTVTMEHEQALKWARQQNFTSVSARYAKLCAEAYDIARSADETSARPMLDEQRRKVFAEHLAASIKALDMRNAYRGPMAPDRAILTSLVEYLENSPEEPTGPASLVGALQDRVHQDPGPVRAAHAVKATDAPTQEWLDRSQGLTGLQYDENGERLPENGKGDV